MKIKLLAVLLLLSALFYTSTKLTSAQDPEPSPSPSTGPTKTIELKANSFTTKVGNAKDPNEDNTVTGTPTQCSGTPVSLGVAKKFLPLPYEGSCSGTTTGACGRPGTCIASNRIVLHTTVSPLDAEGIYKYFYDGAGDRGVGAHFIVGKDGKTIQMVETLSDKVEVAYAVANYKNHISIEIAHTGVYDSKSEAPEAQYQAVLSLIKKLMQTYNIPKGNLEYTWTNNTASDNGKAGAGVYGHYQLNPPPDRSDPGKGFMRDIREDLN